MTIRAPSSLATLLTTARALGGSHVIGTRCTTLCVAQTESTTRSRPSATTLRLWSAAARTSKGPASRALLECAGSSYAATRTRSL